MAKPRIRNPDLIQILPWREWIRENMPTGTEGIVVEDLDLIVLRFGPQEGLGYNDNGRFMLVEIKQKGAPLPYAQKRVFGLVHQVLRRGDPARRYYLGFYLVHWYEEHHVKINGREVLDMEQFRAFLLGKIDIPSMFDDLPALV